MLQLMQHGMPSMRGRAPRYAALHFTWIASLACIVGGCGDLQKQIAGQIQQVIQEIDKTRADLNTQRQEAQKALQDLEERLARHGGEIAGDALNTVKRIEQEAIDHLAEQAKCTADVVADDASYRLLQLKHRLLKTSAEPAPAPRICSI